MAEESSSDINESASLRDVSQAADTPTPSSVSQVPNTETISATSAKPRATLYGLKVEELAVMALFPLVVVLGGLSHLTAPDSYFSNKRNIFNVVFLRQGWLWFSLLFGVGSYFALVMASKHGGNVSNILKRQVIIYVAATAWWYFYAQWCFGIPIMDQIFVWTGGSCKSSTAGVSFGPGVSSRQCKSLGAKWDGGFDPSGHAFIIAHGSMNLILAIVFPFLRYRFGTTSNSVPAAEKGPIPVYIKATLALLGLWLWMLLMTTTYFHSWLEVVGGLIFGYVEVVVVFFLLGNALGIRD